MIIRVNLGFHGMSFGAPAPIQIYKLYGIPPLYNASPRSKQAGLGVK
jgi:hypothetical protein